MPLAELLPRGWLPQGWRWKQRSVLELGSGLGLGAIAARLAGASRIVATDGDAALLELTSLNIKRNSGDDNDVTVMPFSWANAPRKGQPVQSFLAGHDVILAADVLYGDQVSDFLVAVSRLLSSTTSTADGTPMLAVVSIEQREGSELACSEVQTLLRAARREEEEQGGMHMRCHMLEVLDTKKVDWGGMASKQGKRFSVFFFAPRAG